MNAVKVIVPAFGTQALQIILPDGRDIAPDLYVQAIEMKARADEFTLISITCCARVEAQGYIFDPRKMFMGLALANTVEHSGWR